MFSYLCGIGKLWSGPSESDSSSSAPSSSLSSDAIDCWACFLPLRLSYLRICGLVGVFCFPGSCVTLHFSGARHGVYLQGNVYLVW